MFVDRNSCQSCLFFTITVPLWFVIIFFGVSKYAILNLIELAVVRYKRWFVLWSNLLNKIHFSFFFRCE